MDTSAQIQKEIKVLLDKMRFNLVNIPTVQEKENNIYFVNVFIDEPQILIGYQGESLQELQKIFKILFANRYNKNINIIIDVNGYRKKREQKLKETAFSGRIKALRSKKTIALKTMNPYDRRIVHSTLAKFSDISTISYGVGKSRFVSIKPNKY